MQSVMLLNYADHKSIVNVHSIKYHIEQRLSNSEEAPLVRVTICQ
jgi:hypothetical protein